MKLSREDIEFVEMAFTARCGIPPMFSESGRPIVRGMELIPDIEMKHEHVILSLAAEGRALHDQT